MVLLNNPREIKPVVPKYLSIITSMLLDRVASKSGFPNSTSLSSELEY